MGAWGSLRWRKAIFLAGSVGITLLLGIPAHAQLEFLNELGPPGANDFVPLPDSSIYIARTCRIDRYSPQGTLLASYPLGTPTFCRGFFANGLAADENNFYVTSHHTVLVMNKWTGDTLTWGTLGTEPGQLREATGIVIADSSLFICDTTNERIQKFSYTGTPLFQFGDSGNAPGQFLAPWEIEISPSGDLYVADGVRNRILVFNLSGQFLFEWGDSGSAEGEFLGSWGLAIDKRGRVFVADELNNRIQVFDATGNFQFSWGNGGSLPGQFMMPWYVEIGSDNTIYVADSRGRAQRFQESLWLSALDPADWFESWMADSTGLVHWIVGATWHGGEDISDLDPNGFTYGDSVAQVGPAQFIPSHPVLGVDALSIPFRRCEVAATVMNWDSSAVHGVLMTGDRLSGDSLQIHGSVNLHASTWLSAIDPSDWEETWATDSLRVVFWVLGGRNGTSVLDLRLDQFTFNNAISQAGPAEFVQNEPVLGVDALRIPFRRSEVVTSLDWDSRKVLLNGQYTFGRDMHAETYVTVRATSRSRPRSWLRVTSHAEKRVDIEFSENESSVSRLEIVDVMGRRIRSLDATSRSGPRLITWHGETDRGAKAPAGIYIVSIHSGSRRISAKAILLP